MTLSSGDQNNFTELGKQCKQSQYPVFAVLQMLKECDPNFGALVNSICLKDDGRIDATEVKLIRWARTIVFRIGPIDLMEAEGFITNGYYSS